MSDESSKLERLDFWSEIIGPYLGTSVEEGFIHIRIGKKTLAFDGNSKEAEILRNDLKTKFIDRTVGILRTDDLEVPLVVRIIKGQE